MHVINTTLPGIFSIRPGIWPPVPYLPSAFGLGQYSAPQPNTKADTENTR